MTKSEKKKARYYSRDWQEPMQLLFNVYVDACADPILGCSRFAEGSRRKTDSFRLTDYRVDCERGFQWGLRNHPHLVPVLRNVLKEMAAQDCEPVSLADRTELIQRLGPVMIATRKLSPGRYFTTSRRTRCKQ